MMDFIEINELIGKTFTKVYKNSDNDELHLENNNSHYVFYHPQDCCENVQIEDIIGYLSDLINSPIVRAEERTNSGDEDDMSEWPQEIKRPEYVESFTWTFYELATNKGSVTVRWLGESNGYYSESVFLRKVK